MQPVSDAIAEPLACRVAAFQNPVTPAQAGVQLRDMRNGARRSVTRAFPTGPRPAPGRRIVFGNQGDVGSGSRVGRCRRGFDLKQFIQTAMKRQAPFVDLIDPQLRQERRLRRRTPVTEVLPQDRDILIRISDS